MIPVSLADDLEALAAQHPGLAPLVRRTNAAEPDFAVKAPLLSEVARKAGLGAYGALALLLKADWQLCPQQPGRWCPWLDPDRLREPLRGAATSISATEFELLVLELCALSCHEIGCADASNLARRHAAECDMLVAAAASEQEAFVTDKRSWLLDELQLDWLLHLHQQLEAELQDTRTRYLEAIGSPLVEYVEAAHRVALMRYRSALNDPTLTVEELSLRLQRDPESADCDMAFVPLEPELRQALFDTVRGVQDDRQSLRQLASLWAQGNVRPASDEDRRVAVNLLRRLRQLIYPDLLKQHPDYANISPGNQKRLDDIWNLASPTHSRHAVLSLDKLINYVEHLRDWIAEAQRILRCLAYHTPSRLLMGETLEERHADLRRTMADVQRHLHTARDDITQLEFDPRHEEYRRVIAMSEAEVQVECERMAATTARWNDEARYLSMQLAARLAADAIGTGATDHPEDKP